MGQPRFLPRSLSGLLPAALILTTLLGGCGGSGPDLLVVADVTAGVYGSGAAEKSEFTVASTDPAEFGTLSGKVLFEGKARKIVPISLTEGFCQNAHSQGLMTEDCIVGPGGELAGVIVYIRRGLVPAMKYTAPTEPVVLDQVGCQYIPHIVVVQTGQPLVIKSSDSTLHNVRGAKGPNDAFNHVQSTPSSLDAKYFNQMEVPKRIGCDVHGWMIAYVAIVQHPCHAVTGADGSFAIRNVPPGTYELVAWHEYAGEVSLTVTVGNKEAKVQDFTLSK